MNPFRPQVGESVWSKWTKPVISSPKAQTEKRAEHIDYSHIFIHIRYNFSVLSHSLWIVFNIAAFVFIKVKENLHRIFGRKKIKLTNQILVSPDLWYSRICVYLFERHAFLFVCLLNCAVATTAIVVAGVVVIVAADVVMDENVLWPLCLSGQPIYTYILAI